MYFENLPKQNTAKGQDLLRRDYLLVSNTNVQLFQEAMDLAFTSENYFQSQMGCGELDMVDENSSEDCLSSSSNSSRDNDKVTPKAGKEIKI